MSAAQLGLLLYKTYGIAQAEGILDANGAYHGVDDAHWGDFAAKVEQQLKTEGLIPPAQVDAFVALLPGLLKLLGV